MRSRRAFRAAGGVAAGTVIASCWIASAASAAAPQELTVLSPDKIAVTSGGEMKATIVVLNAGDEASVAFRVDADKAITVKPASATVKANDVARVPVVFAPADTGTTKASGQLIVTSANRPPSAVAFDLSSKAETPDWALPVIFVPLGVAVLLLLAAWLTLTKDQPAPGARLGAVDWDFSKSYASTITVFSALLGTILSAGVLPKDLPAERVAAYAALNLLFGVAVIGGPFLYTAFQRPKPVNRRSKDKEPQYQGYVWTFLIAAVVTVWATAGEFWTIAKLFSEIHARGALPTAGLIAFEALIAVAAVGLLVLIWTRSRSILRAQGDPRKRATHRTTKHRLLETQGATGLPDVDAGFEPELDAWPAF